MSHLQLFFKIGEHSQPSQQHLRLAQMGVGHAEPVVAVYLNVGQVAHRQLDLINALFC